MILVFIAFIKEFNFSGNGVTNPIDLIKMSELLEVVYFFLDPI